MKTAVIFAGFGTSDQAARARAISSIARDAKACFPDLHIVEAYTSAFIRRRLAAQGEFVPSPETCLETLAEGGFEEVYIQPLHLTPGEEYDYKILPLQEQYSDRFSRLSIGEPLFYTWSNGVRDDYAAVLDALCTIYPPMDDEVLVLLGHGSPHRHNLVYERLQRVIDDAARLMFIGVVEETDTPDFAMVKERLYTCKAKCVRLAPLLLSGGVHVMEEMAGADAASWKSRLEASGFHVRTELRGLGEYPAFRQLYIKKFINLVERGNL